MVSIHYLFEHPQYIPTLARWFQNEWANVNPEATYESRIQDLSSRTHESQLPLTIIATRGNDLLGTYSLDLDDMHTRSHLSPWLASVYVNPKFRRDGVGSFLVKDATIRAKHLGIQKLYLYTPDQAAWYAKMGWRELERVEYHGTVVTVMSMNIQ